MYAYTTFLPPGLHSVTIFDPVDSQYYKKTIIVEVNEHETKMPVSDSILDELKHELRLAKKREINTFEMWDADMTPVTKHRKEF